jgi:hypothetical protein
MTLDTLKTKLIELSETIEQYKHTGHKTKSLKIRKLLGELKNETPAIRKYLMEADKQGIVAE